MKKVIIIAVILLLFSIIYLYILNTKKTTLSNEYETKDPEITQLVGADKDIHGCIGSAGYLWCEPKNKCLRIWEEECYIDNSQEIQYLLSKKYNKTIEETNVLISKEDGDFASGIVVFGSGGPGEGGVFLAKKSGNMWKIAFDGNGNPDCVKMRQEYGFPDSVLKPNFCD